MTNKKVGNPTLYSEDMLLKTRDYIEEFLQPVDTESEVIPLEVIPSTAGLARRLGVARSTVYLWGEKHPEFQEELNELQATQELCLLNGGLQGRFNSNITKLALANHGYSDKQGIEHSGGVQIETKSIKDIFK